MVMSLIAALPMMAGSQTIGALQVDVQGGSASQAGYLNITQDTRVGTTVYVANSDAAYNKVVVKVTHAASNTDAATENTVNVVVKNSTTGVKISGGVTLTETGVSTGIFTGSFKSMLTPASTDIGTSTGDAVTISFATSGDVVTLKVDGTKPVISVTGPVDDAVTKVTTIDFQGTITDALSGIRTDVATGAGAGSSSVGYGSSDLDGDSITTGEPRTLSTGAAADIVIRKLLASVPSTTFITKTGDMSSTALWNTATNGFSFTASRLLSAGVINWNVQARDRAGNEAITDGNSSTSGSQPLLVTIDSTAPAMAKVETGIKWNTSTKKESSTNVRNWLKVTFTAGGSTLTGTAASPTNGDYLDGTTVSQSDFVVATSSSNTAALGVASIVHPNMKTATSGNPTIETRHIVYIELSNDIASNSKPKVSLVSGIKDVAGNSTSVGDKVSTDLIAPKLTLNVVGESDGRPIARGNKVGREIVITITSDEPVSGTPTVQFTNFDYDADASRDLQVKSGIFSSTPTAVSGSANTWTTKMLRSALGNADGLFGIVVRATDLNSQAGHSGTGGSGSAAAAANDIVNLAAGNLFEIDSALAVASLTLNPALTVATETESTSPFIRIDFAEGNEYGISSGGTAANSTTDPKTDKWDCGRVLTTGVKWCDVNKSGTVGVAFTTVEVDTHNTVTLGTVTLDGVDVSSSVGIIDGDSFVLATSGLALGAHTIKFNGTDQVGNTYTADQSYTFSVKARSAYKTPLSPGWNLISLPGDPADTAIDVVLPASHPATTVLSYDPSDANGPWVTAIRAAGEAWSGPLTNIDSSSAYWIRTGSFTPITSIIPERNASTELPTVPVKAGWNLVPVIDLQLTTPPTEAQISSSNGTAAPAKGIDSDLYFASVTWTVAYGFDTQGNKWKKITPLVASNYADALGQGKGYWLWVTKDGTLVP